MKVVVNALSTTNLSGRHVLLGYLGELAGSTKGNCSFDVLHHAGNAGIRRDFGPDVSWQQCPPWTQHWASRVLWERTRLPRYLRRSGADLLIMASGTVLEGCPVPQWTLAMNPWCLVPGVPRGAAERFKAALQRRAYRRAVLKADMIGFLSGYLRDAYRRNAGSVERRGVVAYAGLSPDLANALGRAPIPCTQRSSEILTVSSMAPHKGIETVVKAMSRLRANGVAPVVLRLVGAWPNPGYERRIRRLVASRGLTDSVMFEGHVSREELLERYARARVFCLMSRCESFGIPAVEAQAFGTPVVSSNGCAIPEVCGEGGIYPEAGDVEGTAQALRTLLADGAAWGRLSDASRRNAGRFAPATVSRPLVEMMNEYITRSH